MCTEGKEISWKEKLNATLLSSKHINATISFFFFSPYNILKGTISPQRYKLNLGFNIALWTYDNFEQVPRRKAKARSWCKNLFIYGFPIHFYMIKASNIASKIDKL